MFKEHIDRLIIPFSNFSVPANQEEAISTTTVFTSTTASTVLSSVSSSVAYVADEEEEVSPVTGFFSVAARLHFDFTYLLTIYLMFRTAKNGGEVGPDQSRSSNHQGQHPFARLFMKKSDLSCPIFLLTCKFL